MSARSVTEATSVTPLDLQASPDLASKATSVSLVSIHLHQATTTRDSEVRNLMTHQKLKQVKVFSLHLN